MLASAVCTARTEAQASEQSEVDRPGNNGKHFPSIFFLLIHLTAAARPKLIGTPVLNGENLAIDSLKDEISVNISSSWLIRCRTENHPAELSFFVWKRGLGWLKQPYTQQGMEALPSYCFVSPFHLFLQQQKSNRLFDSGRRETCVAREAWNFVSSHLIYTLEVLPYPSIWKGWVSEASRCTYQAIVECKSEEASECAQREREREAFLIELE